MPPKSFRVDRTNIKIDDSGLVRCSTHTTLKGYFTVNYGEKYETTEGEDFIKDILMAELKEDYELLTHHVTVAPDSQKMDVFITFTSPKLAESLDGNMFMGQPVFSFSSNPFALEKRFFPIDFTYPAFYHNVITYDIDSGYSVSELPKEIILNASKLEFQRLSFINDDKVVVDSKLLIGEALIAPELYTGVRNLFAEMERANREQVVFVPKK